MAKSKAAAPEAVEETTAAELKTEAEPFVAMGNDLINRVHRPRIYKRMEGDPNSQFAHLWIETQSNLLGIETRVLSQQTYWADIHPLLAQYIRAWNIPGPHEVTVTRPAVLHSDGTTVLVPERQVQEIVWDVLPAPMEAGPEVFESIDQLTKVWIWNQVLAAPYKREPDSGKS